MGKYTKPELDMMLTREHIQYIIIHTVFRVINDSYNLINTKYVSQKDYIVNTLLISTCDMMSSTVMKYNILCSLSYLQPSYNG